MREGIYLILDWVGKWYNLNQVYSCVFCKFGGDWKGEEKGVEKIMKQSMQKLVQQTNQKDKITGTRRV